MVTQSYVAVLSTRKVYERIFEHVLSAKCKNVKIFGELFSFHWFGLAATHAMQHPFIIRSAHLCLCLCLRLCHPCLLLFQLKLVSLETD